MATALFTNVAANIATPDVTYSAAIDFAWSAVDNHIAGTLNISVAVPDAFNTTLDSSLGMKASLIASDGTVYEHDFGIWYTAYSAFESLTKSVVWRIPGSFAATAAICVVEIYSTIASVAPGLLQKTSSVRLPDAVAPDLSGMIIKLSRTSNFPDRAVQISLNGAYSFGSGVLVTYAYQYKRTISADWTTFKRTQDTFTEFVPANHGIQAGESIQFRVLVYSTAGSVVNSKASTPYYCDVPPTIVPRTCIRVDNGNKNEMYMYVIVNGKMRPVSSYFRWFGPASFFDADLRPVITADGQLFYCARGATSG